MGAKFDLEALAATSLGLHTPELQNDYRTLRERASWLRSRARSDQFGTTELLAMVAQRLFDRLEQRLIAEQRAREEAALERFLECAKEALAEMEREGASNG
jgi:hypothetical protein